MPDSCMKDLCGFLESSECRLTGLWSVHQLSVAVDDFSSVQREGVAEKRLHRSIFVSTQRKEEGNNKATCL